VREKLLKDLGLKIRELRGKENQKDFAQKIGSDQKALSRYENGRFMPPLEVLLKIKEVCNVTLDWLLAGKDEKNKQLPEPTIHIVSPEEGQRLLKEKVGIDTFIPVPLIEEKIAAGNPMFIENGDIEGYCVIYEKWARGKNLVCVRVKGESMHPTICDGSIVAIDLSNSEVEEGKVFAAKFNDGCTVKRIFRQDEDYLILSSDNPDRINYRDMIINLKETEETPLIGKIVWAWSKFD
jgi:phage repressor protein C with HTH and peptisase S24 domain